MSALSTGPEAIPGSVAAAAPISTPKTETKTKTKTKAAESMPRDPILDVSEEDSDRYVIGDVVNQEAHRMYKEALASFWVAESVDLEGDAAKFQKLSEDERGFLLMVLAFFAGSDGIVLENLALRFYYEVQQPEVRLFYGLQVAIENIHSEVYTELIQCYERDRTKRRELFRAIDSCAPVKAKAQWAQKWMTADAPFGTRLVAFACVEGILFSASFCAIFYFRKRGTQLPGLYQSNEYISRDEGLHTRFACLLHHQLQPHNRCSEERVLQIVQEAVEVETIFVQEALRKPIIGMNTGMMVDYVKFVADVLLQMLGCAKHYGVLNPFPWMEQISQESKHNFFERRVTNYSLADINIPSASSQEDSEGSASPVGFSLDEEF